MKKILHIVEAMGGGVFTYIVDLSNQLCDDYEVYIAYAIRPQTPKDYLLYFDERIKLIEVKNFTRIIDLKKDVKAFFEIKKLIKEVHPDSIHLHSSKAGFLGRWAVDGIKIPMFYTPHGYAFLKKDDCKLKRFIYKGIELLSAKRNCKTIACSKGEYEATLPLTSNATYINNGINVGELKKMIHKRNVMDHPLKVFTIGRICYQKNPVMFNSIAEELPDINFLWIGDGEMRDKLTSPNIEITGWVDRKKALEYSMEAEVFILPSLWEGLPISLLESMFMKKMCVVSDIIGNRDVIENGINGYVCQSTEEFVEIIKKLKVNLNHKIVEKAYQDVMTEYNTTVMGAKYKNIYTQPNKHTKFKRRELKI